MLARAAIYWAPSANDPLWHAACAWLGRDAETGATVKQPNIPNIADLTAAPRHYGFHCTLRPPMRLATPWPEFRATAEHIAAITNPFALPPLQVRDIDGFLALAPKTPSPALQSLADRTIRETDPHRAPLTEAEAVRRRAAPLTPRQLTLLRRWGYPYVMQEWFFHCTLTRRLTDSEKATLLPAAADHFAAVLTAPRIVNELCIFTQNTAADFLIAERFPFSGRT